MATRKKRTFGEKIAASQQRDFVGRKEQLDLFRRNLELGPDHDDFLNIYNIYGQGGVGKTTLLNEFRRMATTHSYAIATIDTEDQRLFEVTAIMHHIAEQLSEYGGKFSRFTKRYKDYLQEKGRLETDPERPKGAFGSLISSGLSVGAKAAREAIPGAGMVVGDELIKTGARIGGEWADFVARKLTHKDEVELVLSPLKILTPLWLEGLNELIDKQPILLAFDTYEVANPAISKWLVETLRKFTPDFIVAIAGRAMLSTDIWHNFKPYTCTISLAPFTEQEALDYLRHKGFEEQREVAQILAISNHLPVYLSLMAEGGPGKLEESGSVNDQIVSRFLKHISDPLLRTLAISAALPRQLNEDVLRVLLSENEVGDKPIPQLFDWLIKRAFVQKRGGHWAYHPIVRETFQQYLRERSQQRWLNTHQTLADALQTHVDAMKRSTEEGRASEEWSKKYQEVLYHRLCSNYEQHLHHYLNYFVSAWENSKEAEQKILIELLQEVELFAKPIHTWSTTLQRLNAALEANAWQDALNVLELLIKQKGRSLATTNNIFLLFAQGEFFHELGMHEEAIMSFTEVLKLEPKDYKALNNKGLAYYDTGRYKEAIKNYDQAIAILPNEGKIFFNKGLALGELGQYEEAVECYNQAISFNPDDDAFFYNKGFALDELDRYEEAIACYDQAIAIKPDKHEAFCNKGLALDELGRHEEAIKCYDQAIAIKPDDIAFYNKGLTLVDLERYEEAIKSYDQALLIKADKHEAICSKGFALDELGRYEEAIECYNQAIVIKPDYDIAFYNKGLALADLRRYEEAIKSYDQTIAIDPNKHDVFYSKGLALDELGRYEEAIECYNQVILDKPNRHEVFCSKGLILGKLGRYEEAIQSYDQALSVEPDNHEAFYGKGLALQILGHHEKAIECYQHAITIKPNDHDARHELGWVQLLTGQTTQAIANLLKVWEDSKGRYPLAAMNLGHCHLLSQQLITAEEWYQKSMLAWNDLDPFWKGMESDFVEIKMEAHGISNEQFQTLLTKLKAGTV